MYAFGMYNYMALYTSNQYNFYAATQHPCESFTQFANRLRALAANCNFPNLEEELHYRFVMGMLPGPERSLLFTVELSQKLTFAKAVEFVEGIRYTRGATTEWVTPLKTACERPSEDHSGGYCTWKGIAVCHDTNKGRFSTPRSKLCNHKGRSRNLIRLNIYHE